jgi:putative hydrolase of the HAD superfamily
VNLVFDFAGVLFHWNPRELIRRELPQHAVDEVAAEWWLHHFFEGFGGDWADFDRGTLSIDELVPRIAARTGLATADVRRVVHAVPRALEPHGPTVELLSQLAADGHRLFYLSNMPEPYAALLEREHRFLDLFADGVFSARVGAIKPEPAIFDVASGRFDVAPGELLFFDDVPANVAAARAAGWRAEHHAGAETTAAHIARHAAALTGS